MRDAEADGDWPDPGAPARRRRVLGLRAACSLAVAVVLAVWFRGPIAAARAFLWPPTEPLAQWSFLVLLHVGGLVVLPIVIGSFVADRLYPRVFDS